MSSQASQSFTPNMLCSKCDVQCVNKRRPRDGEVLGCRCDFCKKVFCKKCAGLSTTEMDCLTLSQRKLVFSCSEECMGSNLNDENNEDDQIKNLLEQRAKECSELGAVIRAKEAEISKLNSQTNDFVATIQEMKISIETLTVDCEQHILEIKDLKNENSKLSHATPTAVFQDDRNALYTKLYNDLSDVFNDKFSALEALVKHSCSGNNTTNNSNNDNNDTVTESSISANFKNKKFYAQPNNAVQGSSAERLPTYRRNSLKFSAITGTKATNSAGISAAAILPKTAIFVRKLANDVSKDNLLQYLRDTFGNEEQFTLEELNSKSGDYKCFKVVAKNDLETSLLDPKNWPIDVEIKKFQSFRHNRSKQFAASGPRIFRQRNQLNQRNY